MVVIVEEKAFEVRKNFVGMGNNMETNINALLYEILI